MENIESTTSYWKTIILVFHLIITALSWVAPFLVSWYLIVPVYLLVMIQFMIFGRCLVNDAHDLKHNGEDTIYSFALEACGIQVNKPRLYFFVRKLLYPFLITVTLVWQLGLGIEALWF